jgi:hypothetical protein
MFAAWPGMGNVALGAINYLRRKLDMKRFAQVNTQAFYAPDGITVDAGITELPPPPKSVFYFRHEPDLVVLENEVQFSGKRGIDFTNQILNFAQDLGVIRIITAAAFPVPNSYRDTVQLFGVSNMKSGLDLLTRYRIKIMDEGSISGLNGLILGYAQEREIESVCVLATMPIYATGFPNPRAWRALVDIFTQILNTRVDLTELDLIIAQTDTKMEQIETRLQEILGVKEREKTGEEQISQYVLQKIERLFQEAKTSREKALELKRELDRWGLFEMYEDRFLDLFKKD